jgi:large subunit ribosomal protein L18
MDRRKARDRRHRRVRKKVRGTAERPRLVVFKSNRYIYGRTLASASSLEKALRAKSLSRETATEVGKLVVQRAKGAGVEQVVFDRGGYPYHGRVQALAEAVREAGVRF